MLRCFRAEFEGSAEYLEFEGNHVSRQIVVYPEIVLLLEGDEAPDARLDRCTFQKEDEILPGEFQKAWDQYKSIPHSTRFRDMPI